MLRHCGLRDAQASTLLAACEIACRLARQRAPDRRPLSRPEEVARYLALRYQQRDQEVMGALFLDVRHRLLGETEVFRGTLHRERGSQRRRSAPQYPRTRSRELIWQPAFAGHPQRQTYLALRRVPLIANSAAAGRWLEPPTALPPLFQKH